MPWVNHNTISGSALIQCGSGLARESGGSVNDDVESAGLFASKPLPPWGAALCLSAAGFSRGSAARVRSER
ncbi:hypothetical protein CXF97_25915 [Pseudomonas sp. Choline-02u-1]|nr:hypothetical protein CXF97_25915 [Pseudomonas sp. Choline-02u-1]